MSGMMIFTLDYSRNFHELLIFFRKINIVNVQERFNQLPHIYYSNFIYTDTNELLR